jgi:hypothetical protein
MMEEEEEEWRQEQFIQMFMWSNPVVYEKLLYYIILQFDISLCNILH